MNERIKQITGQVLDEIVPETWVALGYDKIKEIQNRTAELIVEECLYIVEGEDDSSADTKSVRLAMLRMKQHFGVEE
jgi:hypothetical protein